MGGLSHSTTQSYPTRATIERELFLIALQNLESFPRGSDDDDEDIGYVQVKYLVQDVKSMATKLEPGW